MKPTLLTPLLALCVAAPALCQEAKKPHRTFTQEAIVKHSPVTDQEYTNTCWCYATASFMESELLRLGKGEIGLSEMFVVHRTHPRRCWAYFRLQGNYPWSPGGQAHDFIDTVRKHGIVPRDAFKAVQTDGKLSHDPLDEGLKGFVGSVAKTRNPGPHWVQAVDGILDAFIGKVPANFTFQGKTHTPESFRDSLGLNWDDYVELSSFTHHPYYKPFRLEVPDNWSHSASYYNLPLEELEEVMVSALQNGHTVVWDGDMSEKTFDQKNLGYAYLPDKNAKESKEGEPEAELEVTPENRQQGFNNFQTTDDHLMHLVGLSKDQAGNRFFITKNSWGEKAGPNKGYIHMSRHFVRMKTVAIMVHKKAIPAKIASKLGF